MSIYSVLRGQQTGSLEQERGYIVKVGEKVPDFVMTTVDGKSMKMSDLRGKIVMLQFTASWCGVCRKEMPFIESEIWQKHKNNPEFALFGLDKDEKGEVLERFAKSTGITYPLIPDDNSKIFELFAHPKAGVTRNVIVDKEGTIVMLTRLYDEAEFKQMCVKIEELLAK
jgi:peroxiredoxin